MTTEVETLVVGGGLIGTFTAFFLAGAGRSVHVLEKGVVGAQSSGANFGNLRLQGRDRRQYPLSLRSQALWERFEQLVGSSCEFEQSGHVYIARSATECDKLAEYTANARAHGVEIEEIDGADARRRWSWLGPGIVAATWSPRCATANPRLATPAVARAARARGARILERCEATRIEATARGFRVETAAHGTFEAKHLVNAAGAWGGAIAERFGEPVPLFPAGPPQFVTEPVPRFVTPSVQAVDGGFIFRQTDRGNVVFAGFPRTASDPGRTRTRVPPHKTIDGVRQLIAAVPRLRSVAVLRVWSGVEGYLPDMIPIIGESATQPGLFHAFGCCGHGFQIAPGIGAVLAERILEGSTSTPIDAFSIARFAGGVAESDKFIAEFDPVARAGSTEAAGRPS